MATAVDMIAAHWPEHNEHTDKFGPPTMDQGAGVLCGCGEVLGWPVEEPPFDDEPEPEPEFVSSIQRPQSERGREAFDKAAAAVAAARKAATPRQDDYAADGPKTGAYGTYDRTVVDAEVVEDIPVRVHAGGMVDGQPVEEWRAEQVAAGHGPSAEVLADLGVADEAQAYVVGDTIEVGGVTFVKHAEPDATYAIPEPSTITEEQAAEVMASPEGKAWSEGGDQALTEGELQTNLGTPERKGEFEVLEEWREEQRLAERKARYEEFGTCEAGAWEGYVPCYEPARGIQTPGSNGRFCDTHWTIDTEQCDAMVPDGRESMDQCDGRTAPGSLDFLCEQHADYTGSGASGQVYENGKVVPLDEPVPEPVAGESKEVETVPAPEPTETGPTPGSGTPILPTDQDSMDPVVGMLQPLDPTQVYTPKDVEIGIIEILRKMQNGDYFLRTQLSRQHAADFAFTMKYQLKIATSKSKAADQRKAEATLACKNELYEQSEAEMLVRATRDTLHSLRSQLMGLQTVAKSLGISIGAPSYGP